jgi:hypothetical protein
LAQNLARVVLGMVKTRRFGAFARMLTVRDQNLYDLYFQAQHQMQEALAAAPPGVGFNDGTVGAASNNSVEDMLADILGADALIVETTAPVETEDVSGSKSIAPKDEAQAFVEHIEKYFLGKLRTQSDDPVLQEYFAFPPALFSQFVHELGVAFVRLGVRKELEDILRKAARYANVEKERQIWKQASLAADAVNTYTDWLGFAPRSSTEEQRTVAFGNKQRTLFNPQPEPDGLPQLSEDPIDYVDGLGMDWAAALLRLVNENVNFDGVRDFDPVVNNQLHAILTALVAQ